MCIIKCLKSKQLHVIDAELLLNADDAERLGRSADAEPTLGEQVAQVTEAGRVHQADAKAEAAGDELGHVEVTEAVEHLLDERRRRRADVDLERVVLALVRGDVLGAVDGGDARVQVDEHGDAGDLDLDGVGLVARLGAGVDDLGRGDVHG